jgi:hypothetical protein
MLIKMTKIMFGVVLLPFCAGFTWEFGETVFKIIYKPDVPYYFLAGGLTYLTMHLLFKKPILTYVFGHELTHALFAVLFGGSVKSFQAGERGGRVTITKTNFVITLAPYFFPLYTFFMLVIYWLAVATDARGVAGGIIFLTGVSFAFHLVLTFSFLQTDQSDIQEHGYVFSYPLIYLFNVVFAGLLIHVLLAKNSAFLSFFEGGMGKGINMTSLLVGKLYGIARTTAQGALL